MAYQGRIMTRSPYFITATASSGTIVKATLDVYIWAGDEVTDKPVNPNYTIVKDYLKVTDTTIEFEISELIRPLFVKSYQANIVAENTHADCLWVATDLTVQNSTTIQSIVSNSYLAMDGYGYFSDGGNPTYPSDNVYQVISTSSGIGSVYFSFPFGGDDIDNYDVVKSDGTTNVAPTSSTESEDALTYATVSTSPASTLTRIDFKNSTTVVYSLHPIFIEECKYSSKEVKYYDRNGALAVTYMFAKSKEALNTSRETYTKNIGSNYSIYSHQKQTFNVLGNESITLNSDWVPESQNEVYKQMMLSEYIWIDDKPVTITSNNLEYKTKLNDKLINYTFTFDYAYNTINNVY